MEWSKDKVCACQPAEIGGSNPTRAQMPFCYVCYILSGSRLGHELITHSEESYRLWCVMFDLETL
jgi:hypothetical protein